MANYRNTRTVDLWWTKRQQVFMSNVGWIVVDPLLCRFWISLSVPEIFAMELWSC